MCCGTRLASADNQQKQNVNIILENVSVANESKLDPPIHTDSIVSIRSPDSQQVDAYVGVIVHDSTFNPGFRKIYIPGVGIVETSLTSCYIATDQERKRYFKNRLRYE